RSLIFVEAAVAASLFVDMLVYGVVVPVLPELVVDRLKLGEREVGLLFASYSLGYLILSPLIGFLSDKYRTRRAPMLVGLFFLSLSTLMFGTFAQFSYPLLLLARTVQGCAGASIWSVAVACLADVYPPSALTGATSRVLVFNTAGFLLGPVVGGVLFQAGGMGMPFFVCTGLAVADLLCWIVIDLEGARREAEDDAEEGDDEAEPEKPGVGTLVLRLLLRPELLVVFAASAVDATLFSGIEPTLPVHLSRRFGASPSTVGLLFIAIEVPNSLVRLVLGPVCDRMSSRGRRFLSAAGLALFGLSAPLTGLVAPPAAVGWVALPLLAFGAAESAYSTPIYAEIAGIVREHAGGEGYGTMYAMWNVCYSAGMLAGPVLCSHLAETAGFAAMLLYVGGATAALGLLVFVVFWMLPSAAEGEEEGEEAVSPAGSGAVGERTPLLGH
ncbi:major facilitator superfamily domain-containing protein, partial [Hyaloraphidium curvatum]